MSSTPSHTTGSIAQRLGGKLLGPDLPVTGLNTMAEAGPGDLTFISNARYASAWDSCKADAAVISEELDAARHDPNRRALIVVENAELAIARLLELFMPPAQRPDVGVHPTAYVHSSASLGDDVRIGPHVSIDRGARLENGVTLHAGVRIGADVTVGDGCEIRPNCVIEPRCVIGRSVLVHGNVTIGADGFGYRPAADGASLVKMPHIGNVVIADHVEIGANSCVDRAKFSSTIIGTGSKIDNQVQIAHNCRIGQWCVIAGQAGLAGSVTVGDYVQIGAKAGIAEGLSIGDRARIGAYAGVMRDVPADATVIGLPAEEARTAMRQAAAVRKLPDLVSQLRRQGKAETP